MLLQRTAAHFVLSSGVASHENEHRNIQQQQQFSLGWSKSFSTGNTQEKHH